MSPPQVASLYSKLKAIANCDAGMEQFLYKLMSPFAGREHIVDGTPPVFVVFVETYFWELLLVLYMVSTHTSNSAHKT